MEGIHEGKRHGIPVDVWNALNDLNQEVKGLTSKLDEFRDLYRKLTDKRLVQAHLLSLHDATEDSSIAEINETDKIINREVIKTSERGTVCQI